MSVDAKSRKVTLSIKAREVTEERAAMAEYGSSDSGASLGDILGAAFDLGKIQKASQKAEEGTEAAEPKAKKSAVKKAPAKKTKAAKED